MSKIGIDFDDVLVQTAAKVMDVYNSIYKTDLTTDDWYDLSPEGLIRYHALDPVEVVQRVMAFQGTYEFVVPPIKGAVEAVTALKSAGHELVIITGRPESIRKYTWHNIEQYFGGLFTPDDLYFVDHFGHDDTEGPINKADVATALGLDFFIDDVVSHADIVAATGVQTILFDDGYKWNQGAVHDGVVRLTSWPDIQAYIEKGGK